VAFPAVAAAGDDHKGYERDDERRDKQERMRPGVTARLGSEGER
jgi:hypothetical protein